MGHWHECRILDVRAHERMLGEVSRLTLVGVAGGALVCLDTVVTLVEALSTASLGNTVVFSIVPPFHVSDRFLLQYI